MNTTGGLCECGCGQLAPIARWTNRRWGHIKGKPVRFVVGHSNKQHGHAGDGSRGSYTTTYASWRSMKSRCLRPSCPGYHRYGGRGITICPQWIGSFETFLKDMGERPSWSDGGLDRINPDGNYEPGNCRWATKTQQNNNRSKQTSCKRGHALDADNLQIEKDGTRRCRTCRQLTDAKWSTPRWRVYCSQFASCRWAGYRYADTGEAATKKPCPHCGKPVAF